jgi:hypothetical protein
MRRGSKPVLAGLLLLLVGVAAALPGVGAQPPGAPAGELRLVLVSPRQAGKDTLRRMKRAGSGGVVLNLAVGEEQAAGEAAGRAKSAGLALYYWIEIGRDPALAEAHPEWMASLQGHAAWRRHFPDAPLPAAGEVVKCFPWVPVRYQEAFDAHLRRAAALLRGLPAPKGILLNDLQAGPSACGCGNSFCHWTPDYGPIRTATELPPDAAARFAAAVQKLSPESEIIPVWTTECEEHEMAKGAACGGVPCFTGACWYAYTEQLMPLSRQSRTIGVLAPYRAFGRDDPRYGPTAGWVRHALASFAELPPERKGEAVPADRLLPVLQGWDVTAAQREAQVRRAREAGARGYVMAEMKIEQGWQPRMVRVPGPGTPAGTPGAPRDPARSGPPALPPHDCSPG